LLQDKDCRAVRLFQRADSGGSSIARKHFVSPGATRQRCRSLAADGFKISPLPLTPEITMALSLFGCHADQVTMISARKIFLALELMMNFSYFIVNDQEL
jgi:hypothetical protein